MYSEHNKVIYNVTRFLFWVYAKAFLGFRVEGTENVPSEGGIIIAPNHLSYFDPPITAVSMFNRMLCFMGKESLLTKPVTGWYLKVLGTFPVRRGEADIKAIKTAVKLLRSGDAVLIFPEGTRGDGVNLGGAMPGIGGIASMAGVPVLPVLIINSNNINLFKRNRVRVKIGRPIYYGKDRKKDKEGYSEFGGEIMNSIRKLDTEGFYRLQEKGEIPGKGKGTGNGNGN